LIIQSNSFFKSFFLTHKTIILRFFLVIMACRICHEPENLISICGCKGTSEFVHEKCILKWIEIKKDLTCEICQKPYKIRLKSALFNAVLWFLSGCSISIFHGFLLWRHIFNYYEDDITSIVLMSCLLNALVSILYGISFWCNIYYKKFALFIWTLCFFSSSICFQIAFRNTFIQITFRNTFSTNLTVDYIITFVIFICLVIATVIKQYDI